MAKYIHTSTPAVRPQNHLSCVGNGRESRTYRFFLCALTLTLHHSPHSNGGEGYNRIVI